MRVEAARLSLVRSMVETNKVLATKDLNEDELQDLLEKSRSVVVRTELLEPFHEHFPLSHTLLLEDRVSHSRSVGSVSPTEDMSLVPCMIETDLDTVDASVCDVLYEEEMIVAPAQEVTQAPAPRFDSSDLLVVENNFPEDVSALDDVDMLSICPTSESELSTSTADTNVCDVFFEEEMIPAPSQEVTRPTRPSFDSSHLLVVEENFPEDVSALDGVEMLSVCPISESELSTSTADTIVCDVFFEEEMIVAPPHEVYQPPVPSFDYCEEESFSVDVVCDLSQMMKMTQRDLVISEEQPISPVQDESVFTQPLWTDIEPISIEAVDHVESPQSQAKVDECDLYYYEEESFSVDVVCDLTQMMKVTQSDLVISEEQPISPVQDESVFTQPLSTDIESVSTDAVDHVESPLSRATVDECDDYYYEEESFDVEVVCDLRQLLQRSTSPFAVEERVSPETVQQDTSVTETSAVRTSDVKPIGVDVAAKNRSSETFVLPQVIVHRVEATSSMSPLPAGVTATSGPSLTALGTATVDEFTVYSHDEETFSESTLEQRTTFDQKFETFEEQQGGVEAQEEEIVEEVAVEQKSLFVDEARRRLEVPEDDVEMYSSGEESMDRWTVETYRLYEVTRNVEADVMFTRSKQLRAASSSAVDTSRGTSRRPTSQPYIISGVLTILRCQRLVESVM